MINIITFKHLVLLKASTANCSAPPPPGASPVFLTIVIVIFYLFPISVDLPANNREDCF